MSNNLNLGPYQVFSNDPVELNQVFARIREEMDTLYGLRGVSPHYDEVTVSSPIANTSAVDLGSLSTQESLFHLTFFAGGAAGLLAFQPGTTYAEISNLLRQQINFASPASLQGRVIVTGRGSQSGSGKGIALTDATGTTLCEVTWDGAAEGIMVGDFTSISNTDDTLCRLYAKASSATESIIMRSVAVEFKFDAGSSVTT